MLKYILVLVVLLATVLVVSVHAGEKVSVNKKESDNVIANKSFYDFTATSIDGKDISMSEYKGKVVLVVNVASQCGFTVQYEGLQELYRKYEKDGLVILGFPSNQFAKQEPGTNEEIVEFCTLNFGVTFPMFSKIDVNGDDTHPLYQFLKAQQSGFPGESIKWNFTKFLINKEGKVLKRFGSTTKPESMEEEITSLLKK